MISPLLTLAGIFSELSMLAFGGGNVILPEMQRQVVAIHGWMTATDFAALFALAQAAPGPNIMVVALVGYRVAGVAGALVSMAAITAPPTVLTWLVLGIWTRFKDAGWRVLLQAALVPITTGLIGATALLIARTADLAPPRPASVALVALTAIVAGLSLRTRLHPLVLLGAGAAIGALLGGLPG
ncbi:MAG TPA: chromate transporter [Acetobacteraceae bacterium]|nr:chromate transporter [Acetobacteraceae bacterium]